MSLSQLILKAKKGDAASAEELFRNYRNYLLLLAHVHLDQSLVRKLDPSDLVQETCVAAFTDLAQFRGESEQELLAWLRMIMANVSLKMVRAYKGAAIRSIFREQDVTGDLHRSAAALAGIVAPVSSPSQRAAKREAAVILADKLVELPEHYRRAIVLHYIQGLTIAEVALRMERSPEAANSLLARALIKLRSLMRKCT